MPLVLGLGCSYSPLLYRPRAQWSRLRDWLVGEVVQPKSAGDETLQRLDEYDERISRGFEALAEALDGARLDALVVLTSDRGRMFDESNFPQLHVFAGDELWGDPAIAELGEEPQRLVLPCARDLGVFLAEELAYAGFDVSEGRGVPRPLGDPEHGATPALVEPLARFATLIPIVPIHVNCWVPPRIAGDRMAPFGTALCRALDRAPQRVAILASGGMSGDPGGRMAGWIDDVLDRWAIGRLQTGRAAQIGRVFEMESLSLLGATQELRLWAAVGAAMERAGARAKLVDYFPLHHAGVGCGFMLWE